MTPSARIAASIELLERIEKTGAPAEVSVAAFFRSRRYAGSKDRAVITARVYRAIRERGRLTWFAREARLAGEDDPSPGSRTLVLLDCMLNDRMSPEDVAAAFDGGVYAPAVLAENERVALERLPKISGEQPAWARHNYPDWLEEELRDAFGDRLADVADALNARAPVDLRINRLKARGAPVAERERVMAMLAEEGIEARPCRYAPLGLRVDAARPVTATLSYAQGFVEIQDEASQIAAFLVNAGPGAQVVDLCAGAGGKTLAMAAAMENRGQIYAFDRDRRRLKDLPKRAKRAGVRNVQVRSLEDEKFMQSWRESHAAGVDRVLVDAPCSGSGTWRRHPEQKWRLTKDLLDRDIALQRELLDQAAVLTRKGGRLVYATCSLLPSENERQIIDFLARHDDFSILSVADAWEDGRVDSVAPEGVGPYLRLDPDRHGTDGFFVAILERAG